MHAHLNAIFDRTTVLRTFPSTFSPAVVSSRGRFPEHVRHDKRRERRDDRADDRPGEHVSRVVLVVRDARQARVVCHEDKDELDEVPDNLRRAPSQGPPELEKRRRKEHRVEGEGRVSADERQPALPDAKVV